MKIQHVIFSGVLLASSTCVFAAEKSISVSDAATYYDPRIIPSNIRTECSELGNQFSTSTKSFLEKKGWSVQLVPNAGEETAEGIELKLLITNATSSGNAFVGHRKSVSIDAELYKDGKLLDTYSGTRDSGGGFGAGFKGSCAVLARCANALGKDVSKWLKKQDI